MKAYKRNKQNVYSNHLAYCADGDTLNADLANSAWSSADARLQAALSESQLVNGEHLLASFGLIRRQNESPAISGQVSCEAQDVVLEVFASQREPGRAVPTPRPPRL